MADLLCGASKFKNFSKSFHIHLVECSPALQKFQHKNLKCVDEENADEDADKRTFRSLVGTHSCVVACYIGAAPTIIIAHEFLGALPVHKFQKASCGWCEKIVDVAEDSLLHFVLSPHPTPGTLYLLKKAKWTPTEEIAKLNQNEICAKAMNLM